MSARAQDSRKQQLTDARQWHGAPCTQAAPEPGWAALGHSAALPAADIYISSAPTAGRAAEQAAPGRWEMGLELLSSHLHQGCAAAVHGHVVKHWERGWGIVPGRAALLCESIPGVMG